MWWPYCTNVTWNTYCQRASVLSSCGTMWPQHHPQHHHHHHHLVHITCTTQDLNIQCALLKSLTHLGNKGSNVTCWQQVVLCMCRKSGSPDAFSSSLVVCACVGLLITRPFDELGNVLAETRVTKAGTILEIQATEWAAHFQSYCWMDV